MIEREMQLPTLDLVDYEVASALCGLSRKRPEVEAAAYDASYVALAEALDAARVTCDEKFECAGAARCPIDTIS